jgi:flavin-dependent dehydrogenase
MPARATKRGTARTALRGEYDVLVCGASFAGLAVARELAGSGARTLIVDRYEIGERATAACGIPTEWARALGLEESLQQTFDSILLHTPYGSVRWRLPWSFSTFDYRRMCRLLKDQSPDAGFETATVSGRTGEVVHTDRGDLRAELIVDALGWRRVLGTRATVQPPDARLSRALEVHPAGTGDEMEIWVKRSYVPAGYGWSFPADGELRIGIGSYDPHYHVKDPTVRLAGDLEADTVRYQGNWIPHRIRPATEGGVFFVGDSAGQCLPTTAEGIRTALYFGLACGRELRAVIDGRRRRREALVRYHLFCAGHAWKFERLFEVQRLYPRIPPPVLHRIIQAMARRPLIDQVFNWYLGIAPPEFARAGRATGAERPAVPLAA